MPQLAKISQERDFSPCLARALKGEKCWGIDVVEQRIATGMNVTKVGRGKIQGLERGTGDFPTWKFTFQSAQFALCENRLGILK